MRIDWQRLFKPYYWNQNYQTCWEWDALLNDILDKAEKVEKTLHRTNIDGVELWTDNWPYAYGRPILSYRGTVNVLPSVKTRKRLRNILDNDLDYVKQMWKKS